MSADRRVHRSLCLEELEPRVVPGIAYPTAYDQYLLELVNRARLNPTAEAARYGIDLNEGLPGGTISSSPKQPLAFNLNIIEAAQLHSNWQMSVGYITHVGPGGTWPWDRMEASGYTGFSGAGENIAMTWVGGTQTAAVANAHELLFVDAGVDGRGHRVIMMNNNHKEIGIGCTFGQIDGWNYLIATEDFGWRTGNSFFTGVVYSDDVLDNDFYTPGEGLGGVTITAVRQGGGTYVTTTWDSGGYTLRIPAGTYDITASGGAYGTSTQTNVYIGTQNVKVDFTGSTVSRPDLQVTSVDAPATAEVGVSFDVSWTVRNGGTGAATSAWTDQLYLSTDATIDQTDTPIGSLAHTTTLNAGGQYTETISVQIDTTGTYYIGVISDVNSTLLEENEGNNTGFDPVPVSVRIRPTIGSLTDSPDPVPPGGDLTLTALSVNDLDGTVTQVAFYRDANGNSTLEVGVDDLLGTDNNGADGWGWTGSTAAIPYGVHRYFAQATDNDGLTSSAASTTGTVGYPDLTLTITDVNCATPAQVGQTFNVSFTEQNGIAVPSGAFDLDFYLSQNTTFGDADDVYLGRYTETTGLAASGSRSRSPQFTIPAGTSVGSYYVYGVIDADNDVTELDEGNNGAWTATTEFDVINARVLRAGDSIMTFSDGDGDKLRVMYTGPGYAVITDANNERPDVNQTDIARIAIYGSTSVSSLSVMDMDPINTFNTLTLGVVTSDGPMRSITITNRGAAIADTHITVTGDLSTMMATGNLTNSSLAVSGVSTMVRVLGNMANASISTGGARMNFMVNGNVTGGSIVTLTGAGATVRVLGAVNDSLVTAENLTSFSAGSMARATVTGSTSLGRAYCMGAMDASAFISNSNTAFIMVRGNVTVAAPGDEPFQVLGGHNLDRLMIMGSVTGATINVGGDLGYARIAAGAGQIADNVTISVGGNLTRLLFLGETTSSAVHITGDANMLFWQGNVTGGGLDVDGAVGMMRVFGTLTGATVDIGNGVSRSLMFMGQMDGATVNVTGGVTMARLSGMTNASRIAITGDTGLFMASGAVEGGSSVQIGGTTGMLRIGKGLLTGSGLTLGGDVDRCMIYGPRDGDSVSSDSTVTLNSNLTKMLMFSGALQGIVDVAGSAVGSLITVNGNLTGSGRLIAAAFGNVSITGSFSGEIGDGGTAAGVDNTLRVSVSGGGGSLLPNDNIFATRMGYP
ncbi:MAG: CARDB domain-containing protein [Planctomycetota bacterium]